MSVSVYVPCFDGASWLEECLGALVAQTRPADEILVVDDGSSDDSATIAQRFAPRVRLVSHDHNRGLAVARNTALAEARGEIVASVDADVRVTPTWLERLLGAFDSPRTGAVGGKLLELKQDRIADRWRAAHMAQHTGDFPLVNPPSLPGANTAVRRDVVRRLGGYEESFRTNYEDADLQHRLLAAGHRCRYEPDAVAHHLRTDDARTVLRTYWGWLRPPFQRAGAFEDWPGIVEKVEANAAFATRALWTDLVEGRIERTYLSLLVLLAFPLADLAHASRMSDERRHVEEASRRVASLSAVAADLPQLVAAHSTRLAAAVAADLARVDFWSAWSKRGSHASPSSAEASKIRDVISAGLKSLPRTWWPAIEEGRALLAADEGWPNLSAPSRDRVTLSEAKNLSARQQENGCFAALSVTESPAPTELSSRGALAARLARRCRDAIGVIGFGERFAGGEVPGAPTEAPLRLLLVTLEPVPGETMRRWQGELADRADGGLELTCIEAHRLRWLPPSVLQQQLVSTGTSLWGDDSPLRALPMWRPEQVDPRVALDELARAEQAIANGRPHLAALLAAGALLVARRVYTPRPDEVAHALALVWPESPPMQGITPAAFVARARELLSDWLFTWEGDGPARRAQERYARLRRAVAT